MDLKKRLVNLICGFKCGAAERAGGRAVSRVGDTGVRLQFGAAASADAAADDDERVGKAKAKKIAKSARARGFRPSESLIRFPFSRVTEFLNT